MTEEKQRIAIAEACGWRFSPYASPEMKEVAILSWIRPHGADWQPECLPDYLNDLNAMHKAEKTLTSTQLGEYWFELSSVVTGFPRNELDSSNEFANADIACAAAAQRAEALLKTLNLWEE